eukprot:g548.t1
MEKKISFLIDSVKSGDAERCDKILMELLPDEDDEDDENEVNDIAFGQVDPRDRVFGLFAGEIDGVNGEHTLLHTAAALGWDEVAAVLIEHGASVEAIDMPAGNTPLHVAAKAGQVSCMSLLIEAGAQVDSRNEDGLTPLHVAAAGRPEAMFVLLSAGADIRKKCDNGSLATHYAACGHVECLLYLILRGSEFPRIDLNAVDNFGMTAAHVAATCGSGDVIALLAENGADLAQSDAAGCTPYHCAVSSGYGDDESVVGPLLAFEGGWRRSKDSGKKENAARKIEHEKIQNKEENSEDSDLDDMFDIVFNRR